MHGGAQQQLAGDAADEPCLPASETQAAIEQQFS